MSQTTRRETGADERRAMTTPDSRLTFPRAEAGGFQAVIHRARMEDRLQLVLRSGVRVAASAGRVTVHLPIPCTDGVFFRMDDGALVVGTDLRTLVRAGDSLNGAGIVSLLTFGAVVPPYTPYAGIAALLPGRTYEIGPDTIEPRVTATCTWSTPDPADRSLQTDEQERTLARVLDGVMRRSCPSHDPVILFSGGVDSSVLALRAASMGWRGTRLMHGSFGVEHPATVAAQAIAGILGLRLDVTPCDPARGYAALSEAGRLFRFPFGDHACVPTHALALDVAESCAPGSVILDGTGADADFGLFGRSANAARAYRIPAMVRAAFGCAYGPLGLYARPGPLERHIRMLRRSALMTPIAFLAAHNPLAGIGYEATREELQALCDACEALANAAGPAGDLQVRGPLLDNALWNAYAAAQKCRPQLLMAGLTPSYPFMEQPIVDLALAHARFWPYQSEPKSALKRMLARRIPPDLVYRAKLGFTAPQEDQFAHPVMLEHLRAAADTSAPLASRIRPRVLKKLVDCVRARRVLPVQTYNYLWSLAFSNTWLSQVASATPSLVERTDQ
ncbi:MAG TPA: asparagine synthase C-terminal domain-containing protein [Chthonomonadales bacterium]|nr:asparagine synthase C-terminal domain-containing protein [Chthonomonadales bacterium]